MTDSYYFETDEIARLVMEGKHRELVGGAWEEIGKLQFSFLVAQGLLPHHRLLDVGCGSLRGGVHFVPYLDPGNYFGVDISQALLHKGLEELSRIDVRDRVPPENLLCSEDFAFATFAQSFDFAIAQSLFTHLGFNRIRRCMEQIGDVLTDDGRFFVTFFERPVGTQARQVLSHSPERIETHDISDPYHYSVEDLAYACRHLPLRLERVADWDHPRGQKMATFSKSSTRSPAPAPASDKRALSIDEAACLVPGDHHYRAYVGPPERFDFMGATQFRLLSTLGLKETDKVLDFGCGSLRLGKLLIPHLRQGCYFGIEPNQWLIDDALRFELGSDAVSIKKPRFSDNSDFDCEVFDTNFDFVMAQSIVTHCGPDLLTALIRNVAAVLKDDGLFAFSYCNADGGTAVPADGWHYPHCVAYEETTILKAIVDANLIGKPIPWYHPGASWIVAARNLTRLPRDEDLHLLRGAVLFDPRFAESRS